MDRVMETSLWTAKTRKVCGDKKPNRPINKEIMAVLAVTLLVETPVSTGSS